MKSNGSYEHHLTIRTVALASGTEWPCRFSNWLMIQVDAGTGYWMHAQQNLQLEPGMVLVLRPNSDSNIRASQIGSLSFFFFRVDPLRLMSLMTLAEHTFFRLAASREEFIVRTLAPHHSLAISLREVFNNQKQIVSLSRLQLLQKFIQVFGNELNKETIKPEPGINAKQRLSDFLETVQTSELMNLSFADLVHISQCTPRHMSRIFREVVGMSFRNKRAELRLTQACDLLAGTDFKIVDVALESGFQSLSLFNLMFAQHFGISPGRWRKNYRNAKSVGTRFRPQRVWINSKTLLTTG